MCTNVDCLAVWIAASQNAIIIKSKRSEQRQPRLWPLLLTAKKTENTFQANTHYIVCVECKSAEALNTLSILCHQYNVLDFVWHHCSLEILQSSTATECLNLCRSPSKEAVVERAREEEGTGGEPTQRLYEIQHVSIETFLVKAAPIDYQSLAACLLWIKNTR